MTALGTSPERERFSDAARSAVYEVIALRRDVRHFREGEDVDEPTLLRILGAAHLAPSVGFSQPWRFVVLRERARRARIRESFLRCRAAESSRFPPARRDQYLALRLEGILEAPVNVCVTVDLRPRGESILGTTVQPEAVRASAYCAVENLWLAARAEGLGVGWVSIVEPAVLRSELALPFEVEPIAYLCIGRPLAFRPRPMLEEVGWLDRRPLEELIHRERWSEAASDGVRAGEGASAGLAAQRAVAVAEAGAVAVAADAGTVADAGAVAARAAGGSDGFDDRARDAALAHFDALTKPRGSLGRLEELGAWYAGTQGRFPCEPPAVATVAIFAADHGVVVEGVSAYSSRLTADMVCNMMAGGAAVNVLARRHDVRLLLYDVGVTGDLSAASVRAEVPLIRAAVCAGTRNLLLERAMTRAEAEAAMAVGAQAADASATGGARLVGTGEVGIGNTTSGAALVCAMTGAEPRDVVGRGTGIDDETHARKLCVVADALERHAPDRNDPAGVLEAVGGLELAATVGFILRSAERNVPIVLDGFLAAASALVAVGMRPSVRRFLVASHVSGEHGAGLALQALGLVPLLSLGMRLGEGTGAVLGIDLVRSAVALQYEMATFATAGAIRDRAVGRMG